MRKHSLATSRLIRIAALITASCCLAPSARVGAQPYGIESRAPNNALLISDLPPDTPGTMQAIRVFDNLTFSQPIYLTQPPAGPSRLWVIEKGGIIKSFPYVDRDSQPLSGQVTEVLNITGNVTHSSEQGLLCVAFDPDYANNGYVYIHYNWSNNDTQLNPGVSRISRFTVSPPTGDSINPASEVVILAVNQPDGESNHKGGMLAFGPDDMLYIALGDGGGGGDNHGTIGNGQDTTTLLGKILRIDVVGAPDPGLNYRIPPDNPFFAGGPAGATTRREIYAYGLRNPWRFSFDRLTGQLLLGDVGQGSYEEVDVITSGGNYGWRLKEGLHCYNPGSNCDQPGLIDPIHEYPRSEGYSITGGYVYYGSAVPELYGLFVYGDYGSGRVWGMRVENGAMVSNTLLVDTSISISSFGQDLAGEVYITGYGDGRIYALNPSTPGGSANFPNKLSDIPALLAAGLGNDQTTSGIIPYVPSAKLWSDGADKERFLALPGTTQIGYRNAGGWDFPENAVILKNFLLPLDERAPELNRRRIETRLLLRKNAEWHGFSYRWNEEGTDAYLLPDATTRSFEVIDEHGQPLTLSWQYPSRAQCQLCHATVANGVLGLATPQMNFDFHYPQSGVTDNQLRALDHIAMFSAPLPASPDNLPRMPDYEDESEPLQSRARAYLAANCSMCHQPGGTTPIDLDLRWETPNDAMAAIEAAPQAGGFTEPNLKIIAKGAPDRSVLYLRMNERGTTRQMPPLATSRIDADGAELIRRWILSLSNPANARNWPMYE